MLSDSGKPPLLWGADGCRGELPRHEEPPQARWMVFLVEHLIYKWMITRATPMTMEMPIWPLVLVTHEKSPAVNGYIIEQQGPGRWFSGHASPNVWNLHLLRRIFGDCPATFDYPRMELVWPRTSPNCSHGYVFGVLLTSQRDVTHLPHPVGRFLCHLYGGPGPPRPEKYEFVN